MLKSYELYNKDSQAVVYGYQQKAIQRMLDFDYVCEGVTDGVREVMRECDVPVAFGVLTTDDIDQAFARTGGSGGDKGKESALVVVEMARRLTALGAEPEIRAGGGSW